MIRDLIFTVLGACLGLMYYTLVCAGKDDRHE